MNKQDYADYERAVASFHEANKIKAGCCGPVDCEHGEPFFSWRPCECCGSHLGGNRETYQFAPEHGEPFEADICVDCVYYLAYGVLDDMTMLDIESDTNSAAAQGGSQ